MDVYQNLGQNEFQSGIVGMMDSGMWPLATYSADTSMNIGIAYPPVPEKGDAVTPIIHASTWSMFTDAKNKDEVWEFIKFIGGPEGARTFGERRYAIPAIKGMAADLGFLEDENLKVFTELGNLANKPPVFIRSAKWFEANSEFKQALEEIFLGDADIQTALDEAAVRMDKILQSN
jgi:multiple sugar transport system substrate-binding protein